MHRNHPTSCPNVAHAGYKVNPLRAISFSINDIPAGVHLIGNQVLRESSRAALEASEMSAIAVARHGCDARHTWGWPRKPVGGPFSETMMHRFIIGRNRRAEIRRLPSNSRGNQPRRQADIYCFAVLHCAALGSPWAAILRSRLNARALSKRPSCS